MCESQRGASASARLDSEAQRTLLTRMLRGGRLRGLPGNERELALVLALAARELPAGTCREAQVNDVLRAWLAGFADPHGVDHANLRRALVDHRFLERDPAGSAYRSESRL